MSDDTVTIEIDGDDGSDTVELPLGLLDLLREDSESNATIVGDLAMFSCAQRIHSALHHGQGGANPELEEIEAVAMELFEERFGTSFGEMTGHQH